MKEEAMILDAIFSVLEMKGWKMFYEVRPRPGQKSQVYVRGLGAVRAQFCNGYPVGKWVSMDGDDLDVLMIKVRK